MPVTQLQLTLAEQVLCSVMKWCWSRLPGGVVTWEAYELFKVGEQGMNETMRRGGNDALKQCFRFGLGPRRVLDLHSNQCRL